MSKQVMIALLVIVTCSTQVGAEYCSTSAFSFSSSPGTVGVPVTINAASNESNAYYKFWVNTVDFCQGSANWVLIRDWSTSGSCTWTPSAAGLYTVVVRVSKNPSGEQCTNMIGGGYYVTQASYCTVEIHPGDSCGGVQVGATYSRIKAMYGSPERVVPSTTAWRISAYYDSLGISFSIEEITKNEVLEDNEPVIMILVYSPYQGKTPGCNGIGSGKSAILAEYGACDSTEISHGYNAEKYAEGILFIYDDAGAVKYIGVSEPTRRDEPVEMLEQMMLKKEMEEPYIDASK